MNRDQVDFVIAPDPAGAARSLDIRIEGVEEGLALLLRDRITGVLRGTTNLPSRMGDATTSPTGPEPGDRMRVGVGGISIAPARRRALEDAVRAEVETEVDSSSAPDACICASDVPGYTIPGFGSNPIPWFAGGTWTPPPSGNPFWTIAVVLDGPAWNWARLILHDGATFDPPVSKNETVIGLANETDWAKEIWFDNLCSGRTGSLFVSGFDLEPRRTRLSPAGCYSGTDTIVFRKPGFFGIWEDIGHWQPSEFWKMFGGTRGDYTWVID
jgi:hypothetical protein